MLVRKVCMQERDEPVNIAEARLNHINRKITELRGVIAELELEAQRIQMGQKPHDLSPILSPISRPIQPCTHEHPCSWCGPNKPAPRPIDIFWQQQPDFNQTAREQQANEQSDAKQMAMPPYENLLQ